MKDRTLAWADARRIDIRSLDVFLGDQKVGTLIRTLGDYHAFSLEQAYRANGGNPVLSLSLRSATGGLRNDLKPAHRALPAFFANLLPEDKLREAMERDHAGQVRLGNDFDLLVALGADLHGAVRCFPSGGYGTSLAQPSGLGRKARFSLTGAQMKLSVMKNTDKAGGLTLPLADGQGQYIAKFLSTVFPGVSENEFANLALAAAIGMDVPERELVDKADFDGIPEDFQTLADGKVLLIKRFDRDANGRRINVEDFAQVFGVYPSRKYEGAAYHDIAAALTTAVSLPAALEFVRRLALAAITGNGDMHLKNCSLIYRRDGTTPSPAPIYDVLSTVPYIPGESMALSLGGERAFKGLKLDRWRHFAHRARLPQPAVLQTVAETLEQVQATWWTLPERSLVPDLVLGRIDAHVNQMAQVLTARA